MRSLRSSIRIQEPREGGRDGAQEPGSVQCSMCLARSWVPESETVKLVLLLSLDSGVSNARATERCQDGNHRQISFQNFFIRGEEWKSKTMTRGAGQDQISRWKRLAPGRPALVTHPDAALNL